MTSAVNAVDPPILTSARLWLTPLFSGDVDELFAMLSDPEVTRYLDIDPMQRPEEVVELLAIFAERRRVRTEARWAVRLAGQRTLIGTCNLSDLDHPNNRAEFGCAFARLYWGQGYATETLQTVLKYAFEVAGLNRVESLIVVGNQASRTMVERSGFVQEGVLRQHAGVHGHYLDDAMYSILRQEYVVLTSAGQLPPRA